MRCVLHHSVCGEDAAVEIKQEKRFLVKSLYFSSLITLKQISENYDNKFNSVQPTPKKKKKTTRSNCAAFLHFSVIIKVKAVRKSCELRDYEI